MINIEHFFVICAGMAATGSLLTAYSCLKEESYRERRFAMYLMILGVAFQNGSATELIMQGYVIWQVGAFAFLPTFIIAPFIAWLWWRIMGKPRATERGAGL